MPSFGGCEIPITVPYKENNTALSTEFCEPNYGIRSRNQNYDNLLKSTFFMAIVSFPENQNNDH